MCYTYMYVYIEYSSKSAFNDSYCTGATVRIGH